MLIIFNAEPGKQLIVEDFKVVQSARIDRLFQYIANAKNTYVGIVGVDSRKEMLLAVGRLKRRRVDRKFLSRFSYLIFDTDYTINSYKLQNLIAFKKFEKDKLYEFEFNRLKFSRAVFRERYWFFFLASDVAVYFTMTDAEELKSYVGIVSLDKHQEKISSLKELFKFFAERCKTSQI